MSNNKPIPADVVITAKEQDRWRKLWNGRDFLIESAGYIFPINEIKLRSKDGDAAISNLNGTGVKRIAILGTRELNAYTREVTRQVVSEFRNDNAVIISGLAIGTDTMAHTVALDCGIPTVAVMATGIENIYPKQNEELAQRIIDASNSAIMTTFPDGTKPQAIHFIDRIKTIVLMSDMLIIPACKEKGTAMVAARLANQWKIPVYAVPGRITDATAKGCLQLIKEGLAQIWWGW